jgi:hypothetical protein
MAVASVFSPLTVPRSEKPQRSAELHDRPQVAGKFLERGRQRFRVRGVTYGPFAPNAAGHPFPAATAVARDFERMGDIGVNAIRTYHVPPEWLLDLADER